MNQNKINVLQVITGLGKGGAERVVLDLCKNIDKQKFDVSVFAFGKKNDLLEVFEKENIKVEFLYIDSCFKIINLLKKIKKIIIKNKIDIIHAHLFHALIISILIKIILFFKIKLIFTAHTINLESNIRAIIVYFTKIFRNVDVGFSNTKNIFDKKKRFIIKNGIESRLYNMHIAKNEKFVFICIGRLERVKNHLSLIDKIKLINADKTFEVWIIGEGDLQLLIENKIRDEQLGDRIKLLGYRIDIKELCNQAHCFILPSLWEGLPISLLEAGATGLPVICTPVGSIPNLINDDNGYLCTIDQFATTMTHVMEHYEEAKRKGEVLKKIIQEEYDVKAMVSKHEFLYNQIYSE